MTATSSKHTAGPAFVSGVRFKMNGSEWHSVNRYDEAKKQDVNLACVGFDPRTGDGLADAHFIAEAFNTAHETGLTPRQLAERCKELEGVLVGVTDLYCELANSGDAGFWNPEKVDEVIAARAALSKAQKGGGVMGDTPKWLDDFSEANQIVLHAAYRVGVIADDLEAVGLSRVADRLAAVASDLDRAAELARDALSANVHESLRNAEQATGNMLLGILSAMAPRPSSPQVEEGGQ